jgi:ATP-dependent helicase HrpA
VLHTLPGAPLAHSREHAGRQLGGHVHPGFAPAAGAARLPDVLRYVRGIAWRLGRLPDNAAPDRDRMRAVHELEALLAARRAAGDGAAPAVREARWLLEELRVAQFAQPVGVKGQVSAKRVRALLRAP